MDRRIERTIGSEEALLPLLIDPDDDPIVPRFWHERHGRHFFAPRFFALCFMAQEER